MAFNMLSCVAVIIIGMGAVDSQLTDIPPLLLSKETESASNPQTTSNLYTEMFPVLTTPEVTGTPPINPDVLKLNKINLLFNGRCYYICRPQCNELNRKQLLAKIKHSAYAFVISKLESKPVKQGKESKTPSSNIGNLDSFHLKSILKATSYMPKFKTNTGVTLKHDCDCYNQMKRGVLYVAFGKEVFNGRIVLDKELPLIALKNRRDIPYIKRQLRQINAKKNKGCKDGKMSKKCRRDKKPKPSGRPRRLPKPTADSSTLTSTYRPILWG